MQTISFSLHRLDAHVVMIQPDCRDQSPLLAWPRWLLRVRYVVDSTSIPNHGVMHHVVNE